MEKEAVTRLMPVITNSRTRFKVGYRACFSPLTSYLIRASFTIERTPLEHQIIETRSISNYRVPLVNQIVNWQCLRWKYLKDKREGDWKKGLWKVGVQLGAKTRSKFPWCFSEVMGIEIYSRYFILCWSGSISRRTGCHWPVIYCGIERCKRVEYGGHVIVTRLSHVRSASGDNRYTEREFFDRCYAFLVCNLYSSGQQRNVDEHVSWGIRSFLKDTRLTVYLISGPRGLLIYVGCRRRPRKSVERSFRTSGVDARSLAAVGRL